MNVCTVALKQFPETARWIHADMPVDAFVQTLAGALQRLMLHRQPAPLEARFAEQRVAAAYFTRLPGQVATLGGVRAAPGRDAVAVDLLARLSAELRGLGIPQVQAVVAADDLTSQALLRSARFKPLARVQHLWHRPQARPSRDRSSDAEHRARWLPADTLAAARWANLLAATFVETLDCPALNGLRSGRQVLEGFLEGHALRAVQHWELLEINGEIAGCLLLKHHADRLLTELVYMGIVPAWRRRRLGELLLERTLDRAQQFNAQTVVVAVDEQNWPALQLYRRTGFAHHQTWSVWLAGNELPGTTASATAQAP